ncbi:discoidin domain-containing protein [Ectopseudomonas mendocina]|nr:discoidin domain-containing protein [Pseudomonas mendocina]TRO13759.1 discoidin domain-containing protein [Pseudomonas mendocina]
MPATDCVNIAVGKSAWQSSLSKYSVGNDAERALYADETLDYAFHTDREMNPWWLLDLGESFLVERIVLGNRRRTCQENARTLAVEVSLDRKSWLTLHAGMLYWYADLCLELASNIPFRYLRLSLREKQYFHLSKVEVWARSSAILPIKDKVILAARTDGLGERLNALLNGLMLAKIFDIPFRFSWSDRFLGDPMHAIDPVCDFFDKKFVDEYFSPESLPGKRWEVGGKNIALAELRNSIVKADVILAPRLGLDEIFGAKFHMPEYFGFSTLFDELPFAREVESAISLARSISLPEGAVGFHLRSGDIFYGRYRKWVNYTYKGVTLPLAKMVIESLVSEGRKVYLFGQDDEAIDYLCREYGTIDIRCSIGEQLEGMGRTQRAMFDLVMLSRFKTILAGSSGFAKQASWIGGGELVMPFHMFDIERQLNSIEGDLLVNADVYNPLQTAFAYWYAYYRGRGLKRYDQDNRFLALAE